MQMIMLSFVHTVDGRTEYMITAGIHTGILYNVILAATFRSGSPRLFTLQSLPPPFPSPSPPVTLSTSFPHLKKKKAEMKPKPFV